MKERNDRLHRREEAMAGLQRSSRIRKWTTFSWAPPTERRIGRDSDGEMVRNEERGADGTEELGVKVGWGKWIEKKHGGGLTKEQQMFPELLSKCISRTTLSQFCPFVMTPKCWRQQHTVSHFDSQTKDSYPTDNKRTTTQIWHFLFPLWVYLKYLNKFKKEQCTKK